MNIENKRLGDIATYINGYAFKPEQWDTNGKPIIRIQNLNNNLAEFNYYNGDINEKYIVNKGDILISWSASIGVYEWQNEEALLNQHIFKVDFNKIDINKQYFKYIVSVALERAMQFMHGSTMKHITKKYFDDIIIPVPNLSIQQEIANILDKSQELIDKRKEQIKALDELVKSKFIEMFGNPSINDKGWRIDKLSTVVTNIENGKSFVCENFNRSDEYPAILKLSAVTYGVYNANENKALTNEDLFVSSVEVKQGDLLFTRKNTPELVGMSAFVYDTEPNLMMPDLIFRFNTNEKINKIYLWKLINNDLFRGKIKSLSNGSAKSMSNISKQRLMELNIPIPPLGLQSQFAEFVKQTDKLKFEMEKSLKELEDNFNSLMQKAFKGELFN